MLRYHVRLSKDTNDTILVEVPEVPGALTFGADREEALLRAPDAIETVLIGYVAETICHELRARWAVSWSYHNKLHLRMGEAKALSNVRKHGVAFLLAVTVFRDPRIVAMFNQDHSGTEVR